MRISETGLTFIKGFESFVPYVYDDKRAPYRGKYREWKGERVRGTLTIGYGHTNAAKHPLKISRGLRVTEAEACKILDVDLDECEEAVNRDVKVPLTQGEYDALVSFAFNCGTGNLHKLIRPLNRGDYNGTRARFDQYVRSKGTRMRGLVRRRNEEQAMWDNSEATVPTVVVHHPAEVDAPTAKAERKKADAIVVANSRRLRWHDRTASFLEYCGLGGTGLMVTLQGIGSFVTDWRTLAIFGAGLSFYGLIKLSKWHSLEEAAEGRYVPSGHFVIPVADPPGDEVMA